ncbi:hypothetical protein F2Q69_00042387 [Brassica cretica]|uniref:Uncharacterized protein n=1 Tax=Brassica cretica TaxID=69181 RepID=A0A8S9NV07_BRACR|nr:hypothetical protein F2Q69_00042387 [Brassica cretica]
MPKIDVEHLNALRPKPKPSENQPDTVRIPSDDGEDSMEVDRNVFLSTVGVVCNLQSNQLCLTLIDPHINYDPIPVKKSQTSSRRINDPGIIAAYHCGVEYETDYLPSIETHTASSIDSDHQKSTDTPQDELVDSRPDDSENDYYDPIMAVNDAPAEDP